MNSSKVFVLDMPIKKVLLSRLRNKNTSHRDFVLTTNRLSHLLWEWVLGYEETNFTKTTQPGIITDYDHYDLAQNKYAVVSILRSAESMVHVGPILNENGFSFGKILIQRNEESKEKEAKLYYKKFPKDIKDRIVFVVDNMLGTGGSLCCALKEIVNCGVPIENIRFLNVLCCEEGIKKVQAQYPELRIFTAQIDPILNENKYIVPGLGDFGDRYYNTSM